MRKSFAIVVPAVVGAALLVSPVVVAAGFGNLLGDSKSVVNSLSRSGKTKPAPVSDDDTKGTVSSLTDKGHAVDGDEAKGSVDAAADGGNAAAPAADEHKDDQKGSLQNKLLGKLTGMAKDAAIKAAKKKLADTLNGKNKKSDKNAVASGSATPIEPAQPEGPTPEEEDAALAAGKPVHVGRVGQVACDRDAKGVEKFMLVTDKGQVVPLQGRTLELRKSVGQKVCVKGYLIKNGEAKSLTITSLAPANETTTVAAAPGETAAEPPAKPVVAPKPEKKRKLTASDVNRAVGNVNNFLRGLR